MNKFYVYVFLREDRYTPYYVGKGSGKRCYSNRRVIPRPQDEGRIVKVKEGLTEEESLNLERTLILFWGRKDIGTGILHNLSDGGDGTSGWVPTQEWRDKRKEHMLENNPFKGQRHTQETREHLSKSKSGRIWVTNGRRDKMVPPDQVPEGFRRGRVTQNKINPQQTKGMIWVTDGKVNKLVREIPDGFYRGRILEPT